MMMVDVACDVCNGPMQTESTKIQHESIWICVACRLDGYTVEQLCA